MSGYQKRKMDRFSVFMNSLYSSVETCSHICVCYSENPHFTVHTVKFPGDKLLGTGRTYCCIVRNTIEATQCSFEVKYCEPFDKALCSSFQEFDCEETWNTFLIPGELKKYAFMGSNNQLPSAPPDKHSTVEELQP